MTDPSAPARLNIVRVINRTFAALGGNFFRFAVFAFVLSYILSSFTSVALSLVLIGPTLDISNVVAVPAAMRVIITLAQIPAYAGFGAVLLGAATWLEGRRGSFGSCFMRGLTAYAPLLLLNAVAFLSLGVGLLLLILPGAFLATIIIVAGPAMAIERMGLLDAFRRSAYLTQGNRWRIFAFIVIAAVGDYAYGLANGLIAYIIAPAFGGADDASLAMAFRVASVLTGTLKLMIIPAALAALHNELRVLKEGPPGESLAKVFD